MRASRLVILFVVVAVAAAIAIVSAGEVSKIVAIAPATPRPFVTADPSVTATSDPYGERGQRPLAERMERRVAHVRGLLIPVEGAALPTDPELLPNAPREYRAGWHEGIDFSAPAGTAVRAVAAGVIVRIDRDFSEWGRDTEGDAIADAVRLGYTPEETLDRIRGRQVWIDHGRGIVTRYAHLSRVADGLFVGDAVEAGRLIGAVGSSGYPEGGPHLHLEIRVGNSYLGDGSSGDALRRLVDAAFE